MCTVGLAQELDPDLVQVQQRLDSIVAYSADVDLTVDISFIQHASQESSDRARRRQGNLNSDLRILPCCPSEASTFPCGNCSRTRSLRYIGAKKPSIRNCSRWSISFRPLARQTSASLPYTWIPTFERIVQAEINTKKEGSFLIEMDFEDDAQPLPNLVHGQFRGRTTVHPHQFYG